MCSLIIHHFVCTPITSFGCFGLHTFCFCVRNGRLACFSDCVVLCFLCLCHTMASTRVCETVWLLHCALLMTWHSNKRYCDTDELNSIHNSNAFYKTVTGVGYVLCISINFYQYCRCGIITERYVQFTTLKLSHMCRLIKNIYIIIIVQIKVLHNDENMSV